jgi:hypothetical protein
MPRAFAHRIRSKSCSGNLVDVIPIRDGASPAALAGLFLLARIRGMSTLQDARSGAIRFLATKA